MRRLGLVLLIVLFVTGSVTGVHASTDCERWFTTYKNELEHSQALKRLAAAKARAKRYAKRKLAGFKPKPKPVGKPLAAHHRKPRMSREEMLHRFNLACGVLPEDSVDGPLLAEEVPPDFLSDLPKDDGVGLLDAPFGQQIAQNDVPQYPIWGNNYPPGLPFVGPPFFGFGGGGGAPSGYVPATSGNNPPGGTDGGTPPGTPGSPGTPGTPGSPGTPDGPLPPPPPPDVSEVPEPGSLVLMLTGAVGAAGAVRRRFRD